MGARCLVGCHVSVAPLLDTSTILLLFLSYWISLSLVAWPCQLLGTKKIRRLWDFFLVLTMGYCKICYLSSSPFRTSEKFLKLKDFKCILFRYLVSGSFLVGLSSSVRHSPPSSQHRASVDAQPPVTGHPRAASAEPEILLLVTMSFTQLNLHTFYCVEYNYSSVLILFILHS